MTRHRKAAKVAFLVIGCAISASMAEKLPPSTELKPPYTEVTLPVGNVPAEAPKKLPAMDPGQILVFWIGGDGKVQVHGQAAATVIEMGQPQRVISMAGAVIRSATEVGQSEVGLQRAAEINSNVSLASNNTGLSRTQSGVDVRESQADTAMRGQSRASGFNSQGGAQNLAKTNQTSGASSADSAVAVKRSDQSASGLAQSQGSASIGKSGKSSDSSSAGSSVAMNTRSNHAASELKESQGSTDLGKSGTSSGSRSVGASVGVGTSHTGGSLANFQDQSMLTALIDGGIIPGFYGSDMTHLLIDQATVVSIEERESFLRLVMDQSTLLDQLLNRPISAPQRPPITLGVQTSLVVHVSVEPIGSIYHGHPAVITLSVTNEGKTPAYDSMIVMTLPQHTTFARTLESTDANAGYLSTYISARSLLLVRIYRPIAPGETFRSGAVFKMDPWLLPKAVQ